MTNRRACSIPFALALCAVPLLSNALRAQAPALRLGPATATFSEDFTRITGLRELRDGSVLVADAGEVILKHVDPRASGAMAIGHTGQGPGEYQSLTGLFALRGDSTLLFDTRAQQWLVLAGTEMLRKTGPARAQLLATGNTIGIDTLGHALLQRTIVTYKGPAPTTLPPGTHPVQDSVAVVIAPMGLERTDTIAKIGGRVSHYIVRSGAPMINAFNPLSNLDQSAMFADGWVAIAYQSPYHVAWRDPSGTLRQGPNLPLQQVAVTAQMQAAVLEDEAMSSGRPKARTMEEVGPWPALVPPFVQTALMAAPDGRLLVLRALADLPGPPRYDVIDRAGALVGTLTLGAHERIAGFGRNTVYITTTDADGLHKLRRHAWPPAGS